MPISGHTLIKIEADCTATSTLDHSKAVQQTVSTVSTNSGAVYTDNSVTPLLTTHVFYQHPGNLILSSTQSETTCKSQATSPVTCLTPPPETTQDSIIEEENNSLTLVQDASNQTEIIEDETKSDIQTEDNTVIEKVPKIEARKEEIVKSLVPDTPQTTEQDSNVLEEERLTEVIKESKPDISGLELLSNSIVEYESNRKLPEVIKVEKDHNPKEVESTEVETTSTSKEQTTARAAAIVITKSENSTKVLDENLGGLNLLCALAEQRFVEEGLEKKTEEDYKHYKQYKKPKNYEKLDNDNKNTSTITKTNKTIEKFGALNECDNKVVIEKVLVDNDKLDIESAKMNVLSKRISCEGQIESCKKDLGYEFGAILSDKTDRNKNETDEIHKSCSCDNEKCKKTDDEFQKYERTEEERKIKQKLADLQREYQEKQLELSKLTPQTKSECGDCHKRSKLSIETIERTPSPPTLPKTNTPTKYILKPPTLCPISPISDFKPSPTFDSLKRKSDSESPSSTPERFSSSKKRKVGRPKKLLSTPGLRRTTETIVAKKPKKGIVGFLLAAKNQMQMQKNLEVNGSPLRYVENEKPVTNKHKEKTSKKKNKSLLPTSSPEFKKKKHKSKLRPKLKAEPKVKEIVNQEEEECSEWEITMPVEDNQVSLSLF